MRILKRIAIAALIAAIPFGVGGIAALLSSIAEAQVSIYGKNVVAKQFTAYNSTATSTSDAFLEAKVSGATGGDPHLRLTIPGGTSWYMGVDNSDSDGLKIGTGTAVGTSNFIHVTTAGVTRFGTTWETPVVTTAPIQLQVAGNAFACTRDTGTDIEVCFGNAGSVGQIGTQTNHRVAITANNGGGTLNVEADGRVWGNHLHNTGTITGTTNQYIASATYTPTLTNVANLSASTARVTQWFRVGNVMHIAGSFNLDPTTTATLTQVGISLPIASALANAFECAGTADAPGLSAANAASAAIIGDATNDRAQIQWTPVDVTAQEWYFTFTCQIL